MLLDVLLSINLEDNRQLTPIVIVIAIVGFIGLVIAYNVIKARDKRKEKIEEKIDSKLHADRVIKGVEVRSHKPTQEKQIHQIKRESSDPKKRAEEEAAEAAAAKNTLIGGKSEAQQERKSATDVFGPMGISSNKAKAMDRRREQLVINGYLQKSNTAPIRPVYSNTAEARQQQRKELESDEVGAEAGTPALVMVSAAPSNVKVTGAFSKVRPNAMKKPVSSDEQHKDETYSAAIKPIVGSEVSNAAKDRFKTEIPAEKPDIMKQGEEAILPAAEKPLAGFAPVKEPKEEAN